MKIFLIIFISSLTLIFLKADEISVFKALICANIITRKEDPDEEKEINSLSPLLLTCFIKINDVQVHRLTENIDKGFDSVLSEEEINDLIDIDSLKGLSEQDVKKRGDELEEAIKELQKIQEGYKENGEDDGYDDGYDDDGDDYDVYDDGPRNNISKKGFFRLIKKGIFNFGNIVLSSWYIICILVVFYLLLLEIRRNNNQETIENKKEKEKEKKEKKDNNDKKNEEEEKEENEDNKENEEKSKEDENKNKDDDKKEKLD